MCNSYRITPKGRAEQGVSAEVAAAAARLPSPLVRKSDKGVVVLKDGQVQVMRWGFARSFNSSVNNTRSDKLAGGMWAEAFRDRRCVIPPGLQVGVDPEADRQRFHVTASGITLVTPEMLGQVVHFIR